MRESKLFAQNFAFRSGSKLAGMSSFLMDSSPSSAYSSAESKFVPSDPFSTSYISEFYSDSHTATAVGPSPVTNSSFGYHPHQHSYSHPGHHAASPYQSHPSLQSHHPPHGLNHPPHSSCYNILYYNQCSAPTSLAMTTSPVSSDSGLVMSGGLAISENNNIGDPNKLTLHHQDIKEPVSPSDCAITRAVSTPTTSSTGQSVLYPWMEKPMHINQQGKTRTRDKYRVVYSDHQRLELEKEFCTSNYITIKRKTELAYSLHLTERQVKIWFQNRRAKQRKLLKKKDEDDRIRTGNNQMNIYNQGFMHNDQNSY
ncbi:uncharacterized protein LOC141855946 [Brevipalpus obovatus]|uniref:uncharacterized protein LOC141855946 n=1 Tax=Brevipalpus obovatus TaxID=246614 RepID=UPI003D9F69EF